MKYAILLSCPIFLLGCAISKTQKELNKHASAPVEIKRTDTSDNLGLCYSLTNYAKMTVINRNKGLSLEEQKQKREDALGADSNAFSFINDFTHQVYSNNITNSVESAITFHKSCLKLQAPQIQYNALALSSCPMAAGAIDLTNMSIRLKKGKEETIELVKSNYPGFSRMFEGGYQQMVSNIYSGEEISGVSYYKSCMTKNLL